jgi:hypothetical protein
MLCKVNAECRDLVGQSLCETKLPRIARLRLQRVALIACIYISELQKKDRSARRVRGLDDPKLNKLSDALEPAIETPTLSVEERIPPLAVPTASNEMRKMTEVKC